MDRQQILELSYVHWNARVLQVAFELDLFEKIGIARPLLPFLPSTCCFIPEEEGHILLVRFWLRKAGFTRMRKLALRFPRAISIK